MIAMKVINDVVNGVNDHCSNGADDNLLMFMIMLTCLIYIYSCDVKR